MTDSPHMIWDGLKSARPDDLRDFLRWHPSQIDECLQQRAQHLPEPLQPVECTELRQKHIRWEADEASLENIERLGSAQTRVIVAGQQPGLLAGPLLTIYKALAAVQLARDLKKRHPDLDFVPVFWTASEDDDYEEVRKAFWPASEGQLEAVLWPHPLWQTGRMIGTLPCAQLGTSLHERVRGSTFETDFRKPVLNLIDEAYTSNNTWEDAFCRVLLRFLAGTGLVIVSPLMPWIRKRGAEIVKQEITRPGQSSQTILERSAELEAANFTAPLHRHGNAINAFWIDEDECRHRIKTHNTELIVHPPTDDSASLDLEKMPTRSVPDLAKEIETHPEHFSFNAVLRPLVQDSVLPTVAQIVGPGEAAYLAQVESIYEAFGVFAPVRWPRPSLTLIPNNVERQLDKYNLKSAEVKGLETHELVKIVLAERGSDSFIEELKAIGERHAEDYQKLLETTGNDTGIQNAIDKLKRTSEKGLDRIKDRYLQTIEKDDKNLKKAMGRIENTISPNGTPQERALNPVVPFAVLYGLDWVKRIADHIDYNPQADHQTLHLSEILKR